VRVSRNKKTGKAKHYAFLEFQYPEVAETAAEAMNDYMLFTQKLVVRVVPKKVKVQIAACAHLFTPIVVCMLASSVAILGSANVRVQHIVGSLTHCMWLETSEWMLITRGT